MRPYPRYKPTGLAWLPSVPEHWEVVRGKQLFRPIDERSKTGSEQLLSVSERHGVVRRENANVTMFMAQSYEGYKLCWPDDLAINSLWAWSYGLGFSHDFGIISTAYSVFRLKDKEQAIPQFYDYFLRSSAFHWEMRVRSKGLWKSRYQLSDADFLSAPMILPPPSEQECIVRYLDEKTAAIDELVRAKEREIELLRERKQALVSAAVTGGLNPATERKDSGVPWIGKIPKGWEVLKLRQILSPVSEKNRPDLPLLSVVREKGVIIRDKDDMEENRNFIPDDLSGYKVVRKGQFAMNKMKAWQGSYGVSPYDGIVSPAYFVFNIRFDNPEYFHLAIRSKVYVDFFAQASDGIRIGQWDLNLAKMKEIPFLVPSAREQKEIVERMPVLFAETDRKIALAEKSIALLQELRTRLVSDAVTGAVEVS